MKRSALFFLLFTIFGFISFIACQKEGLDQDFNSKIESNNIQNKSQNDYLKNFEIHFSDKSLDTKNESISEKSVLNTCGETACCSIGSFSFHPAFDDAFYFRYFAEAYLYTEDENYFMTLHWRISYEGNEIYKYDGKVFNNCIGKYHLPIKRSKVSPFPGEISPINRKFQIVDNADPCCNTTPSSQNTINYWVKGKEYVFTAWLAKNCISTQTTTVCDFRQETIIPNP